MNINNSTTTRSARNLIETDQLHKSVKNLHLDGKKTPKKFKTDVKPQDNLGKRFTILAAKSNLGKKKQEVNEHIMNSKLLEPMIEERQRAKENLSKKKLKIDKDEFSPLSGMTENNTFSKFSNLNTCANTNDILGGKNEKLNFLNSNLVNNFQGNESGMITRQKKFGDVKRFSFNKSEGIKEEEEKKLEVESAPKNFDLLKSKTNPKIPKLPSLPSSDLKTNDIIDSILNSQKKTPIKLDKSKSKPKFRGRPGTKRKLEELTKSEERGIGSKKKKFR
jgi:hypothetical protein